MEDYSITLHSAYSRDFDSSPICGVDDGGFTNHDNKVLLAAVWMISDRIVKVLFDWVVKDGTDATLVLNKMLQRYPAGVYLLHGITFAGFNVVDAKSLQERLAKPLVVVSGSKPRARLIKRALQTHFPDWRERWRLIQSLPQPIRVETKSGEPPIYIEAIGLPAGRAQDIVRKLCPWTRIPEPLRIASIIAKALTPLFWDKADAPWFYGR